MGRTMSDIASAPLRTRRRFLAGLGGLAATPILSAPGSSGAASETRIVETKLTASPGSAQLVPPEYPATEVWAYDGTVPGPVLRLRQGDRLRARLHNALAEPTTIHWHGVRLPNAMDGVPFLTQPSVEPGGDFLYEFTPPDAGTFFYHPHQRSHEQLGRGLAGALVVEERNPPKVDRDLVWMLGSWSLERDASIRGGFGNFHDIAHDGRVGNTVTLNGRVPRDFAVRAGELVRLRIVNAAPARAFALAFDAHRPWIIALDGHPVAPHEPPGGVVELGPGMRADLLIDMMAAPGSRHVVRDRFYPRQEYEFVQLAYGNEPPLRSRPEDPVGLQPNPLREPDLRRAQRHQVLFTGGAMGDMRGLPRGAAWALNGARNACGESAVPFDPLFVLRKDASYVLELVNDTAWHHPIHLHGHAFRLLARNGQPTVHREWLDTVMLAPRERAEIAFVADNPGDWMLHCHVLEHQAGGMMACVRVT